MTVYFSFFQILCNALWYITNQHGVVQAASQINTKITPVPSVFDAFQGYNDLKRKKLKSQQMRAQELQSHEEALLGLCIRPIMNTSYGWCDAYKCLQSLAQCLRTYKTYLLDKSESQTKYRKLDHPARQVQTDISVEHKNKTFTGTTKEQYRLLESDVANACVLEPVFFDEKKHINSSFENNMQRHRFLQNIEFKSFPVDVFRYVPGGSHHTVACIVRVDENRNESEKLTQVSQVTANIRPLLPTFHTHQMKKSFKCKVQNVTTLSPSIVDLIYKELALDSSAAFHPDTQQRLKLIFLGETALMTDLRKLNPGRPGNSYDVFFEKMAEVIESVTAADERRHNVAHLSEWLSLKDLVQKTKAICPENTPVPSTALVRLQFTPRNPYIHSAMNFTSRLPVQYKIQRRQLRINHPDSHYCAALFRYMKQLGISLKESCVFFCCDDKAKISLGEPSCPISTGVRGRQVLAPSSTTIAALDHDVHHKGRLIPSVYLKVEIPTEPDKSFVRGQVTTTVNDGIFQTSSPYRHAASIQKILEESEEETPSVFLRFSDGGTDQRNTLESVKVSLIWLFKGMNFDMVIAARCAPGQSWTNPAERIMSILNIGLQNVALERKRVEEIEADLKKCSTMEDIRNAAESNTSLRKKWMSSIEECKEKITSRFERLMLKEKPVTVMESLTNAQVQGVKSQIRTLFPSMETENVTKQKVQRCAEYKNWIKQHCRERQYSFQIRKCKNEECCPKPTLPREKLAWLPDPILDPSGEHYLPFQEVYGIETTERDRPSLLQKEKPNKEKKKESVLQYVDVQETQLIGDASVYTAQNTQMVVTCVDCQKMRVVYAKNKLTDRQLVQLAMVLSQYDFTCGSPAVPPSHTLFGKIFTKINLTCESKIENAYYSSHIGRPDICVHCGGQDAVIDPEQKKSYKTVHPLCSECKKAGLSSPCMRPYGPRK